MRSVPLTPGLLAALDAAVIVTDHSGVDYAEVAEHTPLIVDTRGVMRAVKGQARVVGLSGTEHPALEEMGAIAVAG
jgi:UDP-N-acetyl-D-mannosaminuronate dehydrogenase